ncbi:MAG TPA: NUDIX hydrolase [Thermomicrobiales bacterium]|nr:NUDIX hydrolase [Thermomicrobiales bacterium]
MSDRSRPSAIPEIPEPPHDETLASRRGYDGAWLHVRVDDARLPSGRIRPREVVEHPGAVAIVALTVADEVVLLRQFHHAIGRSLLGLPAGTLEPGETPVATARRELREETGYVAGEMRELASYYTSPGYTDERLTIFLAVDCVLAPTERDADELIAVAAVPLAAIPALVTPGPNQLRDAKSLIGLLLLLRERAG